MDQDKRNVAENSNNVPNEPNAGENDDEDDDFGEFEGFEGGIEHLQAQPAPSPWATFPDLLPVQTSPATPADEGQSSSRNSNPVNRENVWRPAEPLPWGAAANAAAENRPLVQPVRTLNPPDVSLGTNQGAGGRVTPDNVHDAAHAEGMNHIGGAMGLDARLPVVQLDLLQQQLGDAEHSRAVLEEQVDQLRQRNIELEAEVTSSQAQINELSTRLQRNQETLEQRLSELRNNNNSDLRRDLQQLQEEIRAIRSAQTREQNTSDSSQQLELMRLEVITKFQSLEATIKKEYEELEQKLLTRFSEEFLQIRNTIEKMVQQSVSGTFSEIVKDTVQKNADSCHNNNLMLQLRAELEKHEEHQRKTYRKKTTYLTSRAAINVRTNEVLCLFLDKLISALEEERKRQLTVVSSALQSALQHLTGAMNNIPKKDNCGNKS